MATDHVVYKKLVHLKKFDLLEIIISEKYYLLDNNESWWNGDATDKSSNSKSDLGLELTKFKCEVKYAKIEIEYLKSLINELLKRH